MKKLPVLFDANGRCGVSVNSTSSYPRARDYLAQLDRLGISRGLAWHVTIGSDHIPTANARLLGDLAATPGARGRVLPVFGFSAQMLYEPGAVDELERQMRAAGSRALRFSTAFSNNLRLVEPVLARLAALNPVVFVGFGDLKPDDLLAVAGRLPAVRFVLADISWGRYIETFDLLRRCPNVLAEISSMHTWNALEIAVRTVGADRLLFGLGVRSHNGAALAALALAGLSEPDRARIAHGNLERLLGLAPAVRPAPASRTGVLFGRLLAGRQLGVDVVDAHYHLGASGGYVLEQQDLKGQLRASLVEADRFGVRTVLVSSLPALLGDDPLAGNLELARLLRSTRGRFRPYFAFNPRFSDMLAPSLRKAMPAFVGFKTLCGYWNVRIDDDRFAPMWEYADRHRLPILNHTWQGAHNAPAMLKDVVKEYPNAQFLLGHSGGGDAGRAEAEELAAAHDNVFLEWCGSFCSSRPWEETLKHLPVTKVVYGSDAYAHGVPWELGRLLSLDLPDSRLRPMLGATMRRILAMDNRRG
jgi:predicted TIM-barrel fold metal-dependent hydrolase